MCRQDDMLVRGWPGWQKLAEIQRTETHKVMWCKSWIQVWEVHELLTAIKTGCLSLALSVGQIS